MMLQKGTTDSDHSETEEDKKSTSPVSPKTPPLSLMPQKAGVKRKHEGFIFTYSYALCVS